jgi:hypothetical protein
MLDPNKSIKDFQAEFDRICLVMSLDKEEAKKKLLDIVSSKPIYDLESTLRTLYNRLH